MTESSAYTKALEEAKHSELGFVRALAENPTDYRQGLQLCNKLVLLDPFNAKYHFQKGYCLLKLGRAAWAIFSFDHALKLEPSNVLFLLNKGNALKKMGLIDDAIGVYSKIIQIDPAFPEVYTNLGVAYKTKGNYEEALACQRKAISLRPNFAVPYLNAGVALKHLGRDREALAEYRQALRLDPDLVEAHTNIASLYRELGDDLTAEQHLKKALRLNPRYVDALNNWEILYKDTNRFDEAIETLRDALSISSANHQPLINLGNTYKEIGELDLAIEHYQKASRINTSIPDAWWGQSLAYLAKGDYKSGLPLYDWRWRVKEFLGQPRLKSVQVWSGEDLTGKRIVVTWEQGLGDTFHFCRYLSQLQAKTPQVYFLVQPSVKTLIQSSFPTINVTTYKEVSEPFDYQVALLSLPYLLGLDPPSLKVEYPYLHVPKGINPAIENYVNTGDFKVSVTWQGNQKSKLDKNRSIPLFAFSELFRLPEIAVYPIQKGFGSEQLASFIDNSNVKSTPYEIDAQGGFIETAYILSAMDVVLTSDTAVAHLAGALGKRVFLVLQKVPEWRWGLTGSKTHWYPTMTLFRQEHLGDWSRPMQAALEEIRRLSAASREVRS